MLKGFGVSLLQGESERAGTVQPQGKLIHVCKYLAARCKEDGASLISVKPEVGNIVETNYTSQ